MIPAVATAPDNIVRPINDKAVTLCALSAHTRPIRTVLSNVVSEPRFASAAAARRRWIFCWGVSFEGEGPDEPKSIREDDVAPIDGAEDVKPVEAYGPVEVKRVASEGERAIVGVLQSVDGLVAVLYRL